MHYAVEPSLIPRIKSDYIQGSGSVREIAEKYGMQESQINTVKARAVKEQWKLQRDSHLNGIAQKSMEKAESEVGEWLKTVKNDSKEEWKLITESIRSLVLSGQGIDSDTIAGYARAKKLYDDMMRRSLGLSDISQQVDITSGGLSFHESILKVIRDARELNEQGKIKDEDLLAIDVENIEVIKDPKQP